MQATRTGGLQTGKKVGEYLYSYSDLIGRGNFARVYRGVHFPTGETVAVKAISLDALKSKRLEALVFDEISILQMMDHPNVLRLRQALLSERNCYIVTELCQGGNLEQRLRRGQMSNAEIARVMLQLMEGLRYLRTMGVVHRDFKTANIFLSNGVVKIADFGLAKLYKERFQDLDVGSPPYMAPEALLLNYYGEKTDVWALGVVLYEMLHGHTPFSFCVEERELKYWILRPLSENLFRKDLHPCFKMIINRLMEVGQNRRPSIAELLKDSTVEGLRELMKGQEVFKETVSMPNSEKQPKRKFSFHDKMATHTLFHKKNEASLQTAITIPAKNTQQNPIKPMQVQQPHQLRSNQSQLLKQPNNSMPKVSFKPQYLQQSINRPKQTVPLLPLSLQNQQRLQQSNQLWQVGSSKTNETKEDSEEQQNKHLRVSSQRNFLT